LAVKNRRINNPNQIKALLQEQINAVRHDKDISTENSARTVGYLSNIALSCYKEGEMMEKLNEIEKRLEEQGI